MDAKFIYYYFIVVNQLYHLKIILTVNINFVLQDIVERKSCESETSSSVIDRFLIFTPVSAIEVSEGYSSTIRRAYGRLSCAICKFIQ